jgi:hypothetical protein
MSANRYTINNDSQAQDLIRAIHREVRNESIQMIDCVINRSNKVFIVTLLLVTQDFAGLRPSINGSIHQLSLKECVKGDPKTLLSQTCSAFILYIKLSKYCHLCTDGDQRSPDWNSSAYQRTNP